jgi:hypothetical protein
MLIKVITSFGIYIENILLATGNKYCTVTHFLFIILPSYIALAYCEWVLTNTNLSYQICIKKYCPLRILAETLLWVWCIWLEHCPNSLHIVTPDVLHFSSLHLSSIVFISSMEAKPGKKIFVLAVLMLNFSFLLPKNY